MKKSLFLVLLVVQLSNAQNAKVDSLKSIPLKTERTKELEPSYRNLKVTMEQRDATLSKASNEIRTSMITVTGLCSTRAKDVSNPESIIYLKNIDKTSRALLALSSDLASETLPPAT